MADTSSIAARLKRCMTSVSAAGTREASMLPTIGVAPFSGPNDDELGSATERSLERLGEDGTPYTQLRAVLDEALRINAAPVSVAIDLLARGDAPGMTLRTFLRRNKRLE
jgi:hypothetical protein